MTKPNANKINAVSETSTQIFMGILLSTSGRSADVIRMREDVMQTNHAALAQITTGSGQGIGNDFNIDMVQFGHYGLRCLDHGL